MKQMVKSAARVPQELDDLRIGAGRLTIVHAATPQVGGVPVSEPAKLPSTPRTGSFGRFFVILFRNRDRLLEFGFVSSRFGREAAVARRQAEAGHAAACTARWLLASQATPDVLRRVNALAHAREQAEIAFHQAIWQALDQRHTWREIAPATGMPWQTLYRRYRQFPATMPRREINLGASDTTALMHTEVPSGRTSKHVPDE